MKTLINIVLVASWGMPVIVATTVFKWLFDTDYGVFNALLSRLPGVDMVGHNWFASGPQGLLVIMLLVVWGAVPFVVITLSAGLTQVPRNWRRPPASTAPAPGASSGTSPCPSSSRSS